MSNFARKLWLVPLGLSLALVAADSAARLHAIHQASDVRFTAAPALTVDSSTPSGYAGNQHRMVVPMRGIDGYHWAMQTQSMVKSGDWRVRHSDYDGPPGGREVHWSGLLRWWTVGVAWIDSKMSGTTLAASVESVFPWANTLLFVLVLVALTIVIARRFGSVPAGIFAMASVTVYPAYDGYAVGIFDHHGILSTCAIVSALCLAAGGAGWVRVEGDGDELKGADKALWQWLPSVSDGKRWFIASGIAGGIGLWVGATTQVPVLMGIGAAAVAGAVLARANVSTAWRVEPALWRVWGIAGAATSVALYLIEYFPSVSTVRLEVNHPLYAISWLAAGDLICRLYRRTHAADDKRDTHWMVLDALVVAVIPVVAILVPSTFVLRPGELLFVLHEEYIQEFRSIVSQMRQYTWPQINAGFGLLPVLMLFPAIAVARSDRVAVPARVLTLVVAVPAFVFTLLAARQVRWLAGASALWIVVLVTILAMTATGRASWNGASARKILAGIVAAAVFAIVPVVLLRNDTLPTATGTAFALLTIAAALWASVETTRGALSRWTNARLMMSGAFLGLAMLPHPMSLVYYWGLSGVNFHATKDDVAQLMTREISQKLRVRLGAERGTVLGAPTTSTWMTYFGGMHSLATLYWENAAGITAAAKIFSAAPDDARALIDANGVTHIVIYSWDQSVIDYVSLASRAPEARVTTAADSSFERQIVAGRFPSWVRPIPYGMPKLPYFNDPWVLILEVSAPMGREEALVRTAQFHLANNRLAEGQAALNAALETRPAYLPALIQRANAQFGGSDAAEFPATMQRIGAAMRDTTSLAFEDEVFLAIAQDLAGDSTQTRRTIERALSRADERSVRRLAPDQVTLRFLQLAHALGFAKDTPALQLARSLLAPDLQAQIERK